MFKEELEEDEDGIIRFDPARYAFVPVFRLRALELDSSVASGASCSRTGAGLSIGVGLGLGGLDEKRHIKFTFSFSLSYV